jgi:DNA-binding transcriptional ArsR family regulator
MKDYYWTIPRLDDQRYRDLRADERLVFHELEMRLQRRDFAGVTAEELMELLDVDWSLLRRALKKIRESGLLGVDIQGDVFTITDPLAAERPQV